MNFEEIESKIVNNQISIRELHDIRKKLHRIYYKNWNPRDPEQEKRTSDWMKAGELYQKMALKIWSEFKEKFPSSISYAYSPRENVNSGGRSHIVLSNNESFGRRKREKGDALCKKRNNFWMLSPVNDSEPNCLKCLELAEDILKKASLTK